MAGRQIWRRAVEEALQFLVRHPRAGRVREFRAPRARGVRSWLVTGFPVYLLFYRIDGGDLEIVRLLHGARDLTDLMDDVG
jgi:toxin ParE1/3/4